MPRGDEGAVREDRPGAFNLFPVSLPPLSAAEEGGREGEVLSWDASCFSLLLPPSVGEGRGEEEEEEDSGIFSSWRDG